eukprot:TRINITY_DN3995_c0_g1_i1.p1 TRINITY_DN3995_c0_g1~~TRINITY_DN3995_c0_g1_i1.p1  ORF type:complete len:321 (+),score=87.44 TRINITY_DN3995_c0_g1_i1:47-1009(+)
MASVKDLLDQAETFLTQCQYEQSKLTYDKILSKEPNNTDALDGLGLLLMEMGDLETAKNTFMKSIKLEPNSGFDKYMNLGQLLAEKEAIECFKKGVQLLEIERAAKVASNGQESDEVLELNRQISTAYCAVVEIYLTDLCYEDDAEQVCQTCLDQALKFDTENPEVYQLVASFKISQDKKQDAVQALQKSYNLWYSPDMEDDDLPPFEFRTQTAKLFLELDMPKISSGLLERLTSENDDIAEIWYLLAVSYLKFAPGKAKGCLEAAEELLADIDESDEAAKEMKDEVASLLKLVEGVEDEDEDEDEEEMDDDDDSDNMED